MIGSHMFDLGIQLLSYLMGEQIDPRGSKWLHNVLISTPSAEAQQYLFPRVYFVG